MLRLLRLAAVVMISVVAADLLFRASLLRLVRPVIVDPADGAVVAAPVQVRWEGPRRMRATLRYAGRESWDLGVHESPFEIPRESLRERGLYSVELRAMALGDWIGATRSFSTDGEPALAPAPPQRDDVSAKLAALEESLQEMRDSQEDSHDENTNLYEENASIREENAILTEELQQTAESEQRAAGQLAGLEREYARLADENRLLMDEVLQLRSRLGNIVPCSVWGYFAVPRLQTLPPTRRTVVVSDGDGEVFRSQSACEQFRRPDQSSVSICFCVGSSFGD
jgi:hypothetical protein